MGTPVNDFAQITNIMDGCAPAVRHFYRRNAVGRSRGSLSNSQAFVILLITELKCGHPAVPMNAKVSLSDESLTPGTIAKYTCDAGYELFG